MFSAALLFVQRCQCVAWPWALATRPAFDFVAAMVALVPCLYSVPVASTHLDRIATSSAILRVGRNVRRQLEVVVTAAPARRYMRRRDRLNVALMTLAANRHDPGASLATIASCVGVTDSHISRTLHNETNLHFDRFLHSLRMIDAVVLLQSDRPVHQRGGQRLRIQQRQLPWMWRFGECFISRRRCSDPPREVGRFRG